MEAEQTFRKTGSLPQGKVPVYESLPLCFARAYDLRKEVRMHIPKEIQDRELIERMVNPTEDDAFAMLQSERQCNSFTDWIQGFTPKEHREMIDRKLMLEWQTEREEADKKWREKERAADRALLLKLALVAGGFALLAAIIGAAIAAVLSGE
ncbi:MAG: hypothetical protein V3U31_01985 [Dehalococcoidia bacterium]